MSHAAASARQRASFRLGPVLGRGGEGAVHAIEGRPDQVAKIYSVAPDELKVRKLRAMTKAASPPLLKVAAWPTGLLHRRGVVCGFLMPRVAARRDIHELYGPKSRSEAFPEVDFRFLVHAAANVARAFAIVHRYGHVLGDVNHGNVLVGPDGTVILIDCDSFQIGVAEVFTCDVGVPLFTPPELQGKSFRGLRRTANHDRFGLAVLLFHLLYMGRHPYAGRYLGPGEMPIERAIEEYRFAYGPDRTSYGMERPPGTISLETMGPAIAHMFVQAFGRTGTSGARPTAESWISALDRLKAELRQCQAASWHHYPRALAACPWCEVEGQTGVRLFGQKIAIGGATGRIDVSKLWEAISAVPDPGQEPALPSERLWHLAAYVRMPSGAGKMLRKVLAVAVLCAGLVACSAFANDGGILLALLSYAIAFAVWPRVSPEKRATVNSQVALAQAEWNAAVARWQREASRKVFAEKLHECEKARDWLKLLPTERARHLAKLEAEREARQRQRYLDRFRIDRGNIPGIGTGRTAMLASYGIETAADVDGVKIAQIPGFGEKLTADLIRWRRKHEQNFRFNPHEPVDPRDIAAMDRDLEAKKQKLLSALQQAPLQLRRLSQEITAARPRLMPLLEKAWTALKVAEAQRDAL
jgi:DNA-binding helix-hairpin-helix protein with protein kinase domain